MATKTNTTPHLSASGKRLGGPTKLTTSQELDILNELTEYINNTDFPNLAEYCTAMPTAVAYDVLPDNLYNRPHVYERQLKRLNQKAESHLLGLLRQGKATAGAIFILKQPRHGYTDKQDFDLTSGGQPVKFTNLVPRPKKTK
jgi:hypothetical protein